jgi:hypothetical protein
VKQSHIPVRVPTGAFILNSGLSQQGLEGQAGEGVHAMAADVIPVVNNVPPNGCAGRTLLSRDRPPKQHQDRR